MVQNTHSLTGSNLDMPICSVIKEDTVRYTNQETLLKELRSEVTAIREAKIGLKAKDIGTHSVRSVSAMVMF